VQHIRSAVRRACWGAARQKRSAQGEQLNPGVHGHVKHLKTKDTANKDNMVQGLGLHVFLRNVGSLTKCMPPLAHAVPRDLRRGRLGRRGGGSGASHPTGGGAARQQPHPIPDAGGLPGAHARHQTHPHSSDLVRGLGPAQ